MTTKERKRFAELAAGCAVYLNDPLRQSGHIFRGDMRAIVAALKLIQKCEGRGKPVSTLRAK